MAQRQPSRSSREAKPIEKRASRADELRAVLRIDLIIYGLVIVILILALAGLHPALRVDHTIVGTMVTFATGVIGGLFAYLRYRNGRNGGDGENDGEGEE